MHAHFKHCDSIQQKNPIINAKKINSQNFCHQNHRKTNHQIKFSLKKISRTQHAHLATICTKQYKNQYWFKSHNPTKAKPSNEKNAIESRYIALQTKKITQKHSQSQQNPPNIQIKKSAQQKATCY